LSLKAFIGTSLACSDKIRKLIISSEGSDKLGIKEPTQGGVVMDGKSNDKELKALSHAIMEAITGNEDVMAMLNDLKQRNVVDSSTLLGLALRIGEIIEISGMTFKQEEIEEKQTQLDTAEVDGELQVPAYELIDGRELSVKEVAFQTWSAERFDERAWLKKMGLIY
jgi:hypothetical protein